LPKPYPGNDERDWMSWKIDFIEEPPAVRVKTVGRLNLEQLKQMMAESLAEGARRGTTRFLVDHREMIPDLPVADIYRLPEISLAVGVDRQFRVAIVFAPESESRRDFEFYEIRAHNFGYDHRLFTSPEAALEWLREGGEQ
jgi:hypothetical protein